MCFLKMFNLQVFTAKNFIQEPDCSEVFKFLIPPQNDEGDKKHDITREVCLLVFCEILCRVALGLSC